MLFYVSLHSTNDFILYVFAKINQSNVFRQLFLSFLTLLDLLKIIKNQSKVVGRKIEKFVETRESFAK